MIDGPAARFLAARRDDLNRRVANARHARPAFDPAPFGALLEEVLPRMGGDERVLAAVFDLALLHASRDAFAACPGLRVLVVETLPRLGSLLSSSPRLAGALSNAVEKAPAGAEASIALARRLGDVGGAVETPEALLDAGALAAWRLGEARVRRVALERAPSLPPRAVLLALGLDDWPDSAAAVALAALRSDAWHRPEDVVSDETLRTISRSAARASEAEAGVARPISKVATSEWTVAARVGDFTGFGGAFAAPPLLLDVDPENGGRHVFLVRVGDETWRVAADVYGTVCRRDASGAEAPVRAVGGLPGLRRVLSALRDGGPSLLPDGSLSVGGATTRIPALANATAFTLRRDVLAATFLDSHRIAILAPPARRV